MTDVTFSLNFSPHLNTALVFVPGQVQPESDAPARRRPLGSLNSTTLPPPAGRRARADARAAGGIAVGGGAGRPRPPVRPILAACGRWVVQRGRAGMERARGDGECDAWRGRSRPAAPRRAPWHGAHGRLLLRSGAHGRRGGSAIPERVRGDRGRPLILGALFIHEQIRDVCIASKTRTSPCPGKFGAHSGLVSAPQCGVDDTPGGACGASEIC